MQQFLLSISLDAKVSHDSTSTREDKLASGALQTDFSDADCLPRDLPFAYVAVLAAINFGCSILDVMNIWCASSCIASLIEC